MTYIDLVPLNSSVSDHVDNFWPELGPPGYHQSGSMAQIMVRDDPDERLDHGDLFERNYL